MRISRVILLSTLSLICLKGGFAYADIHPSIPVAGTHTHVTHNTLTQNHPLLSHLRGERSVRCWLFRTERSAMLTSCLPEESNRHIRVASVCFITDAGNCLGREFSSSEETDGKQNPDYKDPGQQCLDAGYKTGKCPELSHPVNFCPSDRNYYKQCVCDEGLVECRKPYYGY